MANKNKTSYFQPRKECFFCGSQQQLEWHHIFAGPCRKRCDELNLCVWLCHKHHNTQAGVHFNRDMELSLKKMAQEYYEDRIGTRDDFRKDFIKSYL